MAHISNCQQPIKLKGESMQQLKKKTRQLSRQTEEWKPNNTECLLDLNFIYQTVQSNMEKLSRHMKKK